jgi:hypothetical protein
MSPASDDVDVRRLGLHALAKAIDVRLRSADLVGSYGGAAMLTQMDAYFCHRAQ